MHDIDLARPQPHRVKHVGLVAAASVIGGLSALAEMAAGEARRRRGHRREDDRKDERRDDRREDRREDRQDDREADRHREHTRDAHHDAPRHETVAAPNVDDDEGGDNHDPGRSSLAAPFPGFDRAASRAAYSDEIPFLS